MASARALHAALLSAVVATARATCLKPGYDVGSGANSCGYAAERKVFAGPGYDFTAHSWIASKGVPAEAVGTPGELDTAAECQALCHTAGADYFAFEPGRLCVCKEAYSEASCLPLFTPYEDNPAMVSGPSSCNLCFREEHDMGGDFNSCGYAQEHKVYAGPGYDFTAHSWIASKGVPTESVATAEALDTAAECQELCYGAGADYFAYEPLKLCVCKNEYEATGCIGTYGQKADTTAGPTTCTSSECFQLADVGGGFNSCGYATEIKIFAMTGYNFADHSWIESKGIPTEAVSDLDDPTSCQKLCLSAGAAYFAYEPAALCVCKAAYAESGCSPLYALEAGAPDITSGPTQCPGCLMQGYDAAGSTNACGYGEEVKVYATVGYDFSQDSWIASKGVPTAHVAHFRTPHECQAICQADVGCAFFAYSPDRKSVV